MRIFSILNKSGQLIGRREAQEDEQPLEREVAVDCGDLPLDGSYKFNAAKEAFVALGHGNKRVSRKAPLSESLALYHTIRALGDVVAAPAIEWADWYQANMKQRDEELIQLKRIRGTRP